MSQFGGKDSKRHFTVVMGGKEHGLYVSSTPSSAAKKAVTKLCAANKSKKVEFSIREITQGSKKKTYGPYEGHIEKLKEPIELKGRVIKYKPVAKLSGKTGAKKGGYKFYMVSPYEEIKKFTPAEIQNQENYLSKLPEAFKNIIINGIAPNDPINEQPVYMSKIPITNNDELYSYLSHNYNTNNLKYWCEALNIEYDNPRKLILLKKIIEELKKLGYDLEELFKNYLGKEKINLSKPLNNKSNEELKNYPEYITYLSEKKFPDEFKRLILKVTVRYMFKNKFPNRYSNTDNEASFTPIPIRNKSDLLKLFEGLIRIKPKELKLLIKSLNIDENIKDYDKIKQAITDKINEYDT